MKPGPETDSPGRPRRERLLALFLLLAHLLGLPRTGSIDALMSTRTPQGVVAWIVSLNAVPYLAVPSYWVFGRNKFQDYVIARRNVDSALAVALVL